MAQTRNDKQQGPRQICQVALPAPTLKDTHQGQLRIFQADQLLQTWQTHGQIISPVKLAGPQSLKDFVRAQGIATAQHKADNPDPLKIGLPLPKPLDGPQRLRPPQWLVLILCYMAHGIVMGARLLLPDQICLKWKVRPQAPRRKDSWSLPSHAIDAESLNLSTNFTLTARAVTTDPIISAYPVTGLAKAVFTGMASVPALFSDTNALHRPVATLPATSCLIDCRAISISGLLIDRLHPQDLRASQHPVLPNACSPVPSVPNASLSHPHATGNAPSATRASTASAIPASTPANAAHILCSP